MLKNSDCLIVGMQYSFFSRTSGEGIATYIIRLEEKIDPIFKVKPDPKTKQLLSSKS